MCSQLDTSNHNNHRFSDDPFMRAYLPASIPLYLHSLLQQLKLLILHSMLYSSTLYNALYCSSIDLYYPLASLTFPSLFSLPLPRLSFLFPPIHPITLSPCPSFYLPLPLSFSPIHPLLVTFYPTPLSLSPCTPPSHPVTQFL